jgi:hypothetical protein
MWNFLGEIALKFRINVSAKFIGVA